MGHGKGSIECEVEITSWSFYAPLPCKQQAKKWDNWTGEITNFECHKEQELLLYHGNIEEYF